MFVTLVRHFLHGLRDCQTVDIQVYQSGNPNDLSNIIYLAPDLRFVKISILHLHCTYRETSLGEQRYFGTWVRSVRITVATL